jgi:hypothetical protein
MTELKFSDNAMQPILDLLMEIRGCHDSGFVTAALALTFILIDVMGSICMMPGRLDTNRDQFINWVDRYLRAAEAQQYQYRGIDVYAARCSLLHTYTAEASLHRKDSSIVMFGYDDGGKHKYNPDHDASFCIIGVASLIFDLNQAVINCLKELNQDAARRKLAIQRMSDRFQKIPYPH